jgi:hypothetical protein
MSRTMGFYNVRDALAQPGCAICRLKTGAARWFLDGLLWECVNDPGMRRDIRQARGFCHEHAWDLVHNGASLGVAIIMRDVLENVLATAEDIQLVPRPAWRWRLRRIAQRILRRREEASAAPPVSTANLVARLQPEAKCPACIASETMERIYLDALVENLLGDDGLLALYQSSEGLCLPHFRRALSRVHDEAVCEALVQAQRAIWEQMVGHLSEIIRKNDYRFRGEPMGEEVGGALRAIASLSGPRLSPDSR